MVSIKISPRMKSSSLFPRLELLSSKGKKIASEISRGENGLTIVSSSTLPNNYVIVKVSGGGFGHPGKPDSSGYPTGATDYGSIGPYRISVELK